MKLMPSDRDFGFFASAVSICAGLYVFLTSGQRSSLWSALLLSGVVLLVMSSVAPKVLRPLNHAWFRLGEVLGRVVSPVILLVIFFFLLTPIGVVMRLFGRDELRLRKKEGGSCWVPREQIKIISESFKNQY